MEANVQFRTVLLAVQLHPATMSPVLLEHMLRGELIGRMSEKGLVESPYFGALSRMEAADALRLVQACCDRGWLMRSSGFYPALSLTHQGEDQLREWSRAVISEVSKELDYRAYYRWRQMVARRLRKPPYRIVTNATLNELASRRPRTLEQLLMVPGLGKRRALRYQEELIVVGQELETQRPIEPVEV